jgi:uncharacterized membrane protein YraQ (UPF0718 family)
MSGFSFDLSDFVFVWWGLLYEAIPFVAVGALLSGAVERCLSREMVVRWFPRHRGLGIAASACLGLVFPMCECGAVPIVRRLMRKGVPVSCGIAYLLAAPIVNPLVIASTAVAFRGREGWTMVGLRGGLGYLIAVLVAAAVWRLLGEGNVLRGGGDDHGEHAHDHARRGGVLGDVLAVAAGDFVVIGGTLVLGAAAAALINSGFSRAAMAPLADRALVAVPGMMALAVALNLCSEADAFVAASFYAFPLTAKLAFLVLGPMVDLKLLLMYAAVFRPKAIAAIAGLAAALVLAACLAGPLWLPLFGVAI